MATTNGVRILIVDDEAVVRKSLGSWLSEEGYVVDTAESGKETLQKLAGESWDVFIVDIKMPGMDGLELQKRLRDAQPDAIIIIMTAYASVETAVEAMKHGAHDYIVKPFEPDNLERLIRHAAERKRLMSENAMLRESIDTMRPIHGIVGSSPAIRRVLEEVQLVAQSSTNVLIRGESGTGKELIARAVHACSERRYMPIVVVNCGSLSEGVLESELFGHEKGAFTGAQHQRKGRFEMADGGTLFLDEIGDISLKTQVDLLRVLEDKRICRVGGNKTLSIDFRLIAATNRNLESMIAEGRFREDLYYRVNVFSINVPPLRERREDVPELSRHFVNKFAQRMNKNVRGVSREALDFLKTYDWPGNVRELQNCMERAVIVCTSDEVQLGDLAFHSGSSVSLPSGKSLAEIERQYIERTLVESEWNVSRAARLLEIDRVTLYNKIKKYGVRRDK